MMDGYDAVMLRLIRWVGWNGKAVSCLIKS